MTLRFSQHNLDKKGVINKILNVNFLIELVFFESIYLIEI